MRTGVPCNENRFFPMEIDCEPLGLQCNFDARVDENIKFPKFFEWKEAVEVIEAIEVVEAVEVLDAAEDLDARKITQYVKCKQFFFEAGC